MAAERERSQASCGRRRRRPWSLSLSCRLLLVAAASMATAAARARCPDEPVDPPLQSLQTLLSQWPLDDPTMPPGHPLASDSNHPICRFDHRSARDRERALRYRQADVPFVLTHHRGLAVAMERWTQPGYLEGKLGAEEQAFRVDVSPSNHFRNAEPPFPLDWTPHFNSTRMTLAAFAAAVAANPAPGNAEPHYYLRFCADEAEGLFQRDLYFLFPGSDTERDPVVMDTAPFPERVRCRWGGAAGTVVAGHFDGLRNTAALLSGARRWILAPPRECGHCYMIASDDHPDSPCYRHCEVDWSRPDLARHPRFANMSALEFILQPGEMLFLPAFWLHAIVHLKPSLQCNAFSQQVSLRGREEMAACGFDLDEALEEEEEGGVEDL